MFCPPLVKVEMVKQQPLLPTVGLVANEFGCTMVAFGDW